MSSDFDEAETFADVLNGFSLRSNRSRDRRPKPEPTQAQPMTTHYTAPDNLDLVENAAQVRAYAWTGGRTHSDLKLEIETLVSTTGKAEHLLPTLASEHQSVARLCHHTKSVAEVGALLSLPLGVVRVLLGDMAHLGLIQVHRNYNLNGDGPNLELLERVRRGLANLGAG
jgi:hypothetical protein